MESQYYKVFDYVNNIISLAEHPEDFADCNFAILCDKYPIQDNFNNFLAKVIYISLKCGKNIWRIYPDKIKEYDIEHISLKTNSRRRMSDKMGEFWVNGSAAVQEFEEHKYYNYSIELVSGRTKQMIEKLREKYNLITPVLFKGEHQELVLD